MTTKSYFIQLIISLTDILFTHNISGLSFVWLRQIRQIHSSVFAKAKLNAEYNASDDDSTNNHEEGRDNVVKTH